MKKLFSFVIAVAALLSPAPQAHAATATATMVDDVLTPSVSDPDDGREYVCASFTINVKGAEGHTVRVEVPWLNSLGKPVYTDIDDDEKAVATGTYEIKSDDYDLEGWVGTYIDAFWLKPGAHKLNGTLRLFDETAGRYIPVTGAKKHTFTLTSKKKAPGIVVTNQYIGHNEYNSSNVKGMCVHYDFEANWLKGKEIKWVVMLYRANGTPIGYTGGGLEKVTTTGTADYTFTTWTDRWAHFPYSGMKLPKGKTNCYAIIKFYDAKTGKPLPATGNKKMEFWYTR